MATPELKVEDFLRWLELHGDGVVVWQNRHQVPIEWINLVAPNLKWDDMLPDWLLVAYDKMDAEQTHPHYLVKARDLARFFRPPEKPTGRLKAMEVSE